METATASPTDGRRLDWRRAAAVTAITTSGVTALVWAIMVTRPKPVPGIPATAPGVLYSTPLARLVSNGAAIATIGAVLLILLLGTSGRDRFPAVAARSRGIGIAAGVIWITATTTIWWLQAAAVSDSGTSMTFLGMMSYAGRVNSGGALLLTIVATVAYTVLAVFRPHRHWPAVCLAVALAGLVAVPVTGHASQSSAAWLTTPAICLHLCAMSLWVGGLWLIALLIARQRAALALVLPRFSTLAGASIATVAVSGLLLVGPRLTKSPTPSPDQLISALVNTPPGWLVLGKVAGLMILAATGGYIRQRLLPAVRRQETVALATLATVELTAMSVTIALATALARPL